MSSRARLGSRLRASVTVAGAGIVKDSTQDLKIGQKLGSLDRFGYLRLPSPSDLHLLPVPIASTDFGAFRSLRLSDE
jgi:hypothetical protein